MRRGQPQIEVTFDIDANGILKVSAEEKSTGKKQDVTIQGATNLSDEEITKAKEDAEKFAEDDRKRRELVESKNKLEQLIYQMENLLEENKDKLPDEAKEEINKLIATSKELKDKDDVTKEEIDKEIEGIQNQFQELYQKHQAQTQNTGWDDIEIADKDKNDDDKKDEENVEWEVIDAD